MGRPLTLALAPFVVVVMVVVVVTVVVTVVVGGEGGDLQDPRRREGPEVGGTSGEGRTSGEQ